MIVNLIVFSWLDMISGIMSGLYELFNLCLLPGLASNSIPLILFLLLNLVDALDQC